MATLQGGILNAETTTAQKIPPRLRDDDERGRLNYKIAFYLTTILILKVNYSLII